MKQFRYNIERWAQQLKRERLALDGEYQDQKERAERDMARFEEGQTEEKMKEFRELMDGVACLQDQEELLLFWIGLELGMTLGAGNALEKGEDSGWGWK